MELYLGSIIEPIRKSIRNMLYFNSKHAPKMLGEAMQKAQDLHIKHLYAIGEDQDSVTSSSDALPEITVNEVTSREDRGWYKNKRDFREHLQNLREISPQRREYSKRVTFNQPSGTRTANNSEYSDSSRNSCVLNNYSKEPENDKSNQQPSVIRGLFTQIMVNPMQLQDHEFTAWLDRLVEARKNQQERRQRPYRNFRKPYNDGRQNDDRGSKPQPLFPHPPVQCYNLTVIPQIAMYSLTPQEEEHESREHSRKSPQNQMKEVRTPMLKQLPHQRSCQDVRMDPRYQKPPQYAEINYHRPSPQMPVEVNKIGPTIQQGMVQRPVQRHTQAAGGPRRPTVPVSAQQTKSVPSLQINENGSARKRDRKQESDPDQNGYVFNCIHENRPFTVNDVGRPVFVNHYYAGEAFIPVTNKKLIKLDECDVSTEISLRNAQPQGMERE